MEYKSLILIRNKQTFQYFNFKILIAMYKLNIHKSMISRLLNLYIFSNYNSNCDLLVFEYPLCRLSLFLATERSNSLMVLVKFEPFLFSQDSSL